MIVGVFVVFAGCYGLAAQQRIGADATSNKWEVLEGCQLIETGWRDGDSFHVRHGDREYVFRLYYVDAPETDATEQERLEDQATFFRLSLPQTMELGREATQFTARQLKTEFTVTTRWESAGGKGKLARFYAIVFANGKNLSAELVHSGLARIHGKRANWPDSLRSTKFFSELQRLELEAREQRRGAWDEERFPRSQAASKSAVSKPSRVDLNDASVGELEALPGIGKTLAERIIAHRPYRRVNDLRKVKGIGDKTLEKLRPHIVVRPEEKGK